MAPYGNGLRSYKPTSVWYKASSQAKDTNSSLFVMYPWPLASLKIEAPAAPFHWMRSKPTVSFQTICKKKSSAKQKTKMVAPVKNESCVCDESLPRKSRRSIFNEFFIVQDQICEILGRLLRRAF